MKILIFLFLIVTLISGCSKPGKPRIINIGMPYSQVESLVNEIQTEPVISSIAFASAFQDKKGNWIEIKKKRIWKVFPDKTCIMIIHSFDEEGEDYLVTGIVVGEKGKGYGDKISWSREQSKTYPKSIDLNNYK